MRPYLKVMYNFLRLSLLKVKCPGIRFCPVQLLSAKASLRLERSAMLQLGDRVSNDGPLYVVVSAQAKLVIGDGVYFNAGVHLSAKSGIRIGDGCQFGPNVCVFDNNHVFNANEGVALRHKSAPVTIGAGTWVGANCVIVKGARIGRNCVIGAGCVVSGDVPDCTLVTAGRQLSFSQIK